MKKIILLAGIAVFIMTACQNQNTFTLTGKFANNEQDGKMVYLQQFDSIYRMRNAIDSIKVENGKFVFSGIAKETPDVRFISVDESVMPATFIVEKGKIELSFDSVLKPVVKGTPMNDQYQQFETARTSIFEKLSSLCEKNQDIDIRSEQFQKYQDEFNGMREECGNIAYNFIKPNITNPVGQYSLLDNLAFLKDSQSKELISLSTPDFKNLAIVQRHSKEIETRLATAVGKQFTDVKGLNFDGKEVKLSDYVGKGKVVLIDFWASWCGPCVGEIPNVISVYQKYKNKGFEIVGISLDEKKEDWKKATDNLKITWPQFSNLKGWNEDSAVAYGVNSIPHTVLIDKDGVIIERGLRGDALKFKLEELFGK